MRSNSLCYILSFIIKMGCFPLKLRSFNSKFNLIQILTDEISVGLHIKTECTRIMNVVSQSKIMFMKKILIQLSVQPLTEMSSPILVTVEQHHPNLRY